MGKKKLVEDLIVTVIASLLLIAMVTPLPFCSTRIAPTSITAAAAKTINAIANGLRSAMSNSLRRSLNSRYYEQQ